MKIHASSFAIIACTLLISAHAAAQQQQQQQPQQPADPQEADPAQVPEANPPAKQPVKPAVVNADESSPNVIPADAAARTQNLKPAPLEPPPPEGSKVRFTADPIGDGGVIIIGATLGLLSDQILSTNEIRPQQIDPTFNTRDLLGIDRIAIHQSISKSAGTLSNVGLFTAVGYAVVDTVGEVFRDGKSAALVDGIMYLETFLVTEGLTNIAKVAFRRPRPLAYIERNQYLQAGGDPATYDNRSVDSSVSFFSGHAAQTAAFSAAATYIAFSRAPRTVRPWLTLAGGALLTSFVSIERVRAAAHFPTDVLAGAATGAAVGALIVHLHREDSVKQRPVWIGLTPTPQSGAMVSASGAF